VTREIILFAWLAAGSGLIAWLLGAPALRRRRRNRLRRRSLAPAERAILARRVPQYGRMPESARRALEGCVRVFLAEKRFVGCGGSTIDDDIRLTIAGYACLPLINRPEDAYEAVRTILVYPTAFVVDQTVVDDTGVTGRERDIRSGEAWGHGQVVLSWEDVQSAGADYNVVVHEFAHQLDRADGEVDGAPVLDHGDYAHWASVLGEAYERLRDAADAGRETLMDPYGAESPGEFFAVASEAFFGAPCALRRDEPRLYEQLARFYRLDPAAWDEARG